MFFNRPKIGSFFAYVLGVFQKGWIKMKERTFSIVIVSYNNLEVLIECLDSIDTYNDIGSRLEIIIVDNSPNKELFDYVSENYKNVKIVKNDNKGFGEANNVGAKLSRGEYLLFLNPDTILIEPIFGKAIQNFEEYPKVGIFGVRLVNRDLTNNMSFFFMDRRGIVAGQMIKLANRLDIYYDGEMFVSGANIFIRREIFFNAGQFDEQIFMYSEEADLTRRVHQLGYTTSFFKNMRIIHLEGQATETSPGKTEVALRRRLTSEMYYKNKYNLDFNKQIQDELRYNYLKLMIYWLTKNESKKIEIKNCILILKEFSKEQLH